MLYSVSLAYNLAYLSNVCIFGIYMFVFFYYEEIIPFTFRKYFYLYLLADTKRAINLIPRYSMAGIHFPHRFAVRGLIL